MMNPKNTAYLLITTMCCAMCASCNTTSQRKYFGLAFDGGRNSQSSAEIYGYIPPRTEVIAPPATIESRVLVFEEPLFTPPGDGSLRQFTHSVRHELIALDRELDHIAVRASIKGPAAESAIDPSLRDFRMYGEMIDSRLLELRPNDLNNRALIQNEIAALLDDAHRSVRNARQNIATLHAID